jgi:hypothetical protein
MTIQALAYNLMCGQCGASGLYLARDASGADGLYEFSEKTEALAHVCAAKVEPKAPAKVEEAPAKAKEKADK